MESALIEGKNKKSTFKIDPTSAASLVYHNLFDYPLTQQELIKWSTGEKHLFDATSMPLIVRQTGLYFLDGKKGLVLKRHLRQRVSSRKLKIATKAAVTLSRIPTIKMVGVTGSLAMRNASEDSDIDLMVITSKNFLWTSRLIAFFLLKIAGFKLRKAGKKEQKDKLCINIWLDESDLTWESKKRNVYTSHEIAQVGSLVNKAGTFENFLWANRWIKAYWPNAVRIRKNKSEGEIIRSKPLMKVSRVIFGMVEKASYNLQKLYMRKKITKEVITPTRALFHPFDWSEEILSLLEN